MNEFDIPDRNLYCAKCEQETKFVAKVTGPHSWHYYCSICGIRHFNISRPPKNKRERIQVNSWLESEENRIKEERLLKAFNL